MDNIEQQIQNEIEYLKENENVIDLEELIVQGADARVPIIIDYPMADGTTKKVTAKIRPLTNIEAGNVTRVGLQNKNTTPFVEILKKTLYTKNDDEFPVELIEKMPSGVVEAIGKEVMKISGIKTNEEDNVKIAKELMGF